MPANIGAYSHKYELMKTKEQINSAARDYCLSDENGTSPDAFESFAAGADWLQSTLPAHVSQKYLMKFLYWMGLNVTLVRSSEVQFYYIVNDSGTIFGSPEALFAGYSDEIKDT